MGTWEEVSVSELKSEKKDKGGKGGSGKRGDEEEGGICMRDLQVWKVQALRLTGASPWSVSSQVSPRGEALCKCM